MKNTDTPPTMQYEQGSFTSMLKDFSSEALEAIRRGEIIDEEAVLKAEYDERLNQAWALWCLGGIGFLVWFFFVCKEKSDLGFWDVAKTLSPFVGGLVAGLYRIYGPGKRLAEAPLIQVIDPGVL